MNQPPEAPRAQALGHRTAMGFLWMLGQTFTNKLVGIASQLILAWLLMPEDFGLVGLAYTVTVFANLIQRAGVQELLVQRPHFRRWATPAFWIALVGGLTSAGVMLLLGPLAAWLYNDPRVFGLIAVLAAAAPIQACQVVPRAHLLRQMRFPPLVGISIMQASLRALLSIVFAAFGFGAYSFILPQPIAFAAETATLWWIARPSIRWRLRLKRWRYMLGDAAKTLGGDFNYAVINQVDYVALGLFHPSAIVGQYFFAYNLSASTLVLLSVNLRQAIFPTLSLLVAEPGRQSASFLRACRALAVVGVPACFLQAAAAGPAIRLFFDERWLPAIPLFTVLSLGMAFSVLHGPCVALVQARGRFGLYLVMTGAYAAAQCVGCLLASGLGGATAVACVVASLGFCSGVGWLCLALGGSGVGLKAAMDILGRPALASVLSIGSATAAAYALPMSHWVDIYRLAIVAILGGLLYLPAIRLIAPEPCADLTDRFFAATKSRLGFPR